MCFTDLKTAEVGSGYVDMTSGGGSSLYFQYTRHRDRDRHKMRMIKSRNMRDMFSSDCEAVSVASDNPNMYHRSISMVSDFQMVSNDINESFDDTDLLLEKYLGWG